MPYKSKLRKLQQEDPEFLESLLAVKNSPFNEDVGSFLESDGEVDVSQDSKDFSEEEEEEFSDDSDGEHSEDKEFTGESTEVTFKLLRLWQKQLESNNPKTAFYDVNDSLEAALESLNKPEDQKNTKYLVKSNEVFNEVVRTCVVYVPDALRKILWIKDLSQVLFNNKKFKRHSFAILAFYQRIYKLLRLSNDEEAQILLLSSVLNPLVPVLQELPQEVTDGLTDTLVRFWCAKSGPRQCQAFRAFLGMVKVFDMDFLEKLIFKMHLSFLRNCHRADSASALQHVRFMRLSLAEIYSRDTHIVYKLGADKLQKMKDLLKKVKMDDKIPVDRVYNWKFVNALDVWLTVLRLTFPSEKLEPLLCHFTELSFEVLELRKSLKFAPLALKVAGQLVELSEGTGRFLPVLPFIIGIYTEIKPLGKPDPQQPPEPTPAWEGVLELSHPQMVSQEVLRSLLKEARLLAVRYLAVEAHRIAFPEMVEPSLKNLMKYEKKKEVFCQSLTRKLVEKMQEQCDFIAKRRPKEPSLLKDTKFIKDWEIALKKEGSSPMVKYLELIERVENNTGPALKANQKTSEKKKINQKTKIRRGQIDEI